MDYLKQAADLIKDRSSMKIEIRSIGIVIIRDYYGADVERIVSWNAFELSTINPLVPVINELKRL